MSDFVALEVERRIDSIGSFGAFIGTEFGFEQRGVGAGATRTTL